MIFIKSIYYIIAIKIREVRLFFAQGRINALRDERDRLLKLLEEKD